MTSCSGACKSRSSLLAMHAGSPLNGRSALPVGLPIARILTGCHRSNLWLSLLILHKTQGSGSDFNDSVDEQLSRIGIREDHRVLTLLPFKDFASRNNGIVHGSKDYGDLKPTIPRSPQHSKSRSHQSNLLIGHRPLKWAIRSLDSLNNGNLTPPLDTVTISDRLPLIDLG